MIAAAALLLLGQDIVINPERIAFAPGPVLRASSLVGAPELPPGGVTVTFRCQLGRRGRLDHCVQSSRSTQWDAFARRRLPGYVIDVADLRLSGEEVRPSTIAVTLQSDDQIDRAVAGVIHPDASQLVMVSHGRTQVTGSFYPPSALRADVSARLSLTCRILPDLSLFCPEGRLLELVPEGRVDPVAVEERFLFAAQQETGRLRVAPTLRNGAASAGYQFRMTIAFQPAG